MKHRKILAALLILTPVLILTARMGTAWSYFTTYTEARGGYAISLPGSGDDETDVEESFSSWTKHVRVSNDEGADPVFIRAAAFCGSEYELIYSSPSGLWTRGSDGYYYYRDILYGGQVTEELQVRIANIPEDVEDGDSFNVVVVYESTPVRYDAEGNPYADWSATLDSGSTEGGASA